MKIDDRNLKARQLDSIRGRARHRRNDVVVVSATRLRDVVVPAVGDQACVGPGTSGPGWRVLFVAVHERTRLAYASVQPDGRSAQVAKFLLQAVSFYKRIGENTSHFCVDGTAHFQSLEFARMCQSLNIVHGPMPELSPQARRLAERVTDQAMQEWADRWGYASSADRDSALVDWLRSYNLSQLPGASEGGLRRTSLQRLRQQIQAW